MQYVFCPPRGEHAIICSSPSARRAPGKKRSALGPSRGYYTAFRQLAHLSVCVAKSKLLRKYAIRHPQAFWPRPAAFEIIRKCTRSCARLSACAETHARRVGSQFAGDGGRRGNRCNRCDAARQPWQIWRTWQSNPCMFLNLKATRETESLSLRQSILALFLNKLIEIIETRILASPLRGLPSSSAFLAQRSPK